MRDSGCEFEKPNSQMASEYTACAGESCPQAGDKWNVQIMQYNHIILSDVMFVKEKKDRRIQTVESIRYCPVTGFPCEKIPFARKFFCT